jgi:hypothetical protein
MSAAQVAGWASTVLVLAAYAISTRLERPGIFDVANVIGCVGIGWSALEVGAWPSLAVTLSFGLIGGYGMIRARRARKLPGRSWPGGLIAFEPTSGALAKVEPGEWIATPEQMRSRPTCTCSRTFPPEFGHAFGCPMRLDP